MPNNPAAKPAHDSDDRFSPHFSVHEMLRSQTATRKKIDEQFSPSKEVMENLKFLCTNLLEKVRELNDDRPVFISSGYRCPALNEAVGGKPNSQHLTGQAADIDFGTVAANKAFFDKIKNSNLEFDQLLNEFNYDWVHISIKKEGVNRRDVRDITQ